MAHKCFLVMQEGQDLDEVRALILSQLDSIKSGSFNESLMRQQ